MFENVKVEKLDHFGRGIAYLNGKVVFINNALPGEIVDIKIISEKKKYIEADVVKYIKQSNDRIESLCPYFLLCGGCNLLFYEYQKTIDFKLNKVKELIKKNNINYNKKIDIIKNDNNFNYRNKVSLKIVDNRIGFYKDGTHELIEIKKCMIANKEINKVIENYKLLNLDNANLTIRCNYNGEILLIINSDSNDYNIELENLKNKIKLVGIVYNDKTIYGSNFFYERIGGYLKLVIILFFKLIHIFVKNYLV